MSGSCENDVRVGRCAGLSAESEYQRLLWLRQVTESLPASTAGAARLEIEQQWLAGEPLRIPSSMRSLLVRADAPVGADANVEPLSWMVPRSTENEPAGLQALAWRRLADEWPRVRSYSQRPLQGI